MKTRVERDGQETSNSPRNPLACAYSTRAAALSGYLSQGNICPLAGSDAGWAELFPQPGVWVHTHLVDKRVFIGARESFQVLHCSLRSFFPDLVM